MAGEPGACEPFGARCWRNWQEYEAGAPPGFEATLYSDASFSGGPSYPGIGPYSLFNVISMSDGELREALVIRGSWHLENLPEQKETIPKKSQTESRLGVRLDQEIAALLALFLGRRVWSGGYTREFPPGDPAGRPVAHDHSRPNWTPSKRPVLPGLASGLYAAQVSLDGVPDLLRRLPSLDPLESVALVRAARQYQLAVWVADEDPELAWLQLVSAIEVAATFWRGQSLTPAAVLTEAHPDLVALLDVVGGHGLVTEAAEILKYLVKSMRRFLDFMSAFDPGPPEERATEAFQVPWPTMRKRLGLVYGYRSNRLHGGEPFPPILLEPPLMVGGQSRASEKPEGLAHFAGPSEWPAAELPMYLWLFEYTVRGALLRWFTESLGARSSRD